LHISLATVAPEPAMISGKRRHQIAVIRRDRAAFVEHFFMVINQAEIKPKLSCYLPSLHWGFDCQFCGGQLCQASFCFKGRMRQSVTDPERQLD
jgi:hypothetical protein